MAETISVDIDKMRDLGLTFYVQPTWRLTKAQFGDIQRLRQEHYLRELAQRDPEQIAAFTGKMALKSVRNLNREVGISRFEGQRYARQRFIGVIDQERVLRAGYRTEDNASSKHLRKEQPSTKDRLKGIAEIAGKLYLPVTLQGTYLPESRWRVVEEIFHDNSVEGISFVLPGLDISDEKDRAYVRSAQPMSAYPYSEETAFRQALGAMSFVNHGEVKSDHTLSRIEPAKVERWTAESAQYVRGRIGAINGANEAIDYALANLRS